jgi:hypothetical protein
VELSGLDVVQDAVQAEGQARGSQVLLIAVLQLLREVPFIGAVYKVYKVYSRSVCVYWFHSLVLFIRFTRFIVAVMRLLVPFIGAVYKVYIGSIVLVFVFIIIGLCS